MAENEGKTSTSSKTDDPSEPKAKAASDVSTEPEAKGKRAPAKPAKGRAASARHAEEDDEDDADEDDDDDEEDDDDADDEDDDEEEEEEEVKAPPPKRSASSTQKGKAASSAAKGAAKGAPKRAKASVYRKPPPAPVVPRKPARYYVPYVVLGLAFVALHVWFDAPFQPVACAGIAIVIWAYLQIGSANEIISSRR